MFFLALCILNFRLLLGIPLTKFEQEGHNVVIPATIVDYARYFFIFVCSQYGEVVFKRYLL